MAFIHSPKIVTSGLILAIDPSNPKCYTSGSSTARSLVNNYIGSLFGGTYYSSDNNGVWNFDGVNDIINFGTGNTFFPLSSLTIDLWFQSKGTVPTTGTAPGLFGFTYGLRAQFGSANSIQFGASSGSASPQHLAYTHTSNFRDDGLWYNLVCQVTPTNSYIYLNGELKTSRSLTWLGNTIWPTDSWVLGRDNNNSNYFFTGSMASYKMYNRALSAAEVQQNYNALKGRFGL